VILIGLSKSLNIGKYTFPSPTGSRVTLATALANLPEPSADDICAASFSSRYMSRNRKRGWDEVSYTIPAMAKQVALHPSSPDMIKLGEDHWAFGDGTTRRLSWQEAAAIQTFPQGMEFCGNLTSKYKQIGNAVPVKLAEAIAKDMYRLLNAALAGKERLAG
jgi:DNA (cytosine-5)-methyltransferase 1